MKELYTSPEMKVLCFAPVERLANGNVTMDDLLGNIGLGATETPMSFNNDDIELDLSL